MVSKPLYSYFYFLTQVRQSLVWKGQNQHRYRLLEEKVPRQEFLMVDQWLSSEGCHIYCQLLGQIQYPANNEYDESTPAGA